MKRFSFEQLTELLGLNSDQKNVSESIEIVNNSECVFFSGIIMSQDHISSLYRIRFENAKERSTLGEEYLRDYQNTVANLETSQAENLGLAGIYSRTNNFLVFFEPDTKKILGVLKSKSNDHSIELVDNPDKASGFEKYTKGKIVE